MAHTSKAVLMSDEQVTELIRRLRSIEEKIDRINGSIADHGKRISVLEALSGTISTRNMWAGVAALASIGALVGGILVGLR